MTKFDAKEYLRRRQHLASKIGSSVGVIFAGDHPAPAHGRWESDRSFFYLTGIDNEPGATLLLDPKNENPRRRIILFLKPSNPELEQWTGMRPPVTAALKESLGIGTVLRTNQLPAVLTEALRKSKSAACLHPFTVYPADVSPDLRVFQQVAQRVPGVQILDHSSVLSAMRAVKTAEEIKLIERAANITVGAFGEVLKMIRRGLNESQVQSTLESIYKREGGQIAYGTIVGGGLAGTVLHYNANDQVLIDGDLVVIDSAASFGGYASDITRTFPVSGKYTSEQRELYEVVLTAQAAAIKAARPGAKMFEVDAAARDVISHAGLADAFIHSIGHPLGLDVHDVVPDHPLEAGMVITVEPGIYLVDRKIGIRIEDDLLITRTGNRNLTAGVPKSVKEVESAMAR